MAKKIRAQAKIGPLLGSAASRFVVVTAHALAPEVAADKPIRQETLDNHRRPGVSPGAEAASPCAAF